MSFETIVAVTEQLGKVGVDVTQGWQWLPAQTLVKQYFPQVELALPLLIANIVDHAQARQLRDLLLNAYPGAHPVQVITVGNTGVTTPLTTTLAEVCKDGAAAANLLWYLPPLPEGAGFSALQNIMARLRSPNGCPWDREQTLLSMRHDLLSECAEVLEAIDLETSGVDNGAHIAEELGDLLMAAVLIVQIATEAGRFRMTDAMQTIVTKLIRRHPHVFGDTVVDGVETVLRNWEAIKAQEKAAKGELRKHPFDGVPAALPALEKARQLQSKAAKAGLLDREMLIQALPPSLATKVDEQGLGELLWRLVALGHKYNVNAEDALRSYAIRFRNAENG